MGEPIPKPKKRKKKSDKFPKELYLEVLERDNFSCALCGSSYWLECHHIHYGNVKRTHEIDNLVMLCKTHHEEVHANKRKFVPILEEYIKNKKEN